MQQPLLLQIYSSIQQRQIVQLIEAASSQVVYLPPYSPALNRIETCWG
ncbi:transposase [Phormidium tenue]|nr:transposase [Phormidium tenue]MBD2234561.1 transposase [Phormidium tenue FACHB-1052]